MKALDLFCGGGGASYGLFLAGFDVTGIDIERHKYYPFTFIQQSVLELTPDYLGEFDLIWASPPCQAYSISTVPWSGRSYQDLIPFTRDLLQASDRNFIIENVPGAPLRNSIRLCGSMFNLPIIRHRFFESNHLLLQPAGKCVHPGEFYTIFGNGEKGDTVENWSRALGIVHKMTKKELAQAIPPAYSRFLAEQIRPGINWF